MTYPSTSFVQLKSSVFLHLHAPVFGSCTYILQPPDLQPQVIISVQLSGSKARVISLGTSFPSTDLVHPMVSAGSGRVWFVLWACLHNIAWKWVWVRPSDMPLCCITFGGSNSGDLHRANNVERVSSPPSALYTAKRKKEVFYGLHSRVIQVSISQTF